MVSLYVLWLVNMHGRCVSQSALSGVPAVAAVVVHCHPLPVLCRVCSPLLLLDEGLTHGVVLGEVGLEQHRQSFVCTYLIVCLFCVTRLAQARILLLWNLLTPMAHIHVFLWVHGRFWLH